MKQFHIAEPGKSPHGPYAKSMIMHAYEHGSYPPGTLVWVEGSANWMPIESVLGPRRQKADNKSKYIWWMAASIVFLIMVTIFIGQYQAEKKRREHEERLRYEQARQTREEENIGKVIGFLGALGELSEQTPARCNRCNGTGASYPGDPGRWNYHNSRYKIVCPQCGGSGISSHANNFRHSQYSNNKHF